MTNIVRYDRRVDDEFLSLFRKGGLLHSLARLGKTAAFPLDLQFRKDPKNPGKQWATLYAGLTGVLYVHRVKNGLRLDAHDTWSRKKSGKRTYGFRPKWLQTLTLDDVQRGA
jgi:hypothetical protein